ncbi:FAST kinase domain-containing protein 5, mitochondrial-like [Diprion similis]|uniref:FAST kinase domain-containing protein 5, mitochondrial-like n=1 Tax=Diprion similis TaxID=362088 RepID=UPI001EF75ED5|nr:FAST kinase domain-containing protein 5, mitochondrial-like [Diprion similis]
MYKFILSHCRVKIFRQFEVKLNSARDLKSKQILAAYTPCIWCTMPQVQFYSNWERAKNKSTKIFFDNDESYFNTEKPHVRLEKTPNRLTHRILEQRKAYNTTIVYPPNRCETNIISEDEVDKLIQTNWRLEPISKLVESFRKISHYACQKNEKMHANKYVPIMLTLATSCKKFSDEQLSHVLCSLMLWISDESDQDARCPVIIRVLDHECKARAEKWSYSQILLISDHWYRLKWTSRSPFIDHIIIKLGNDVSNLSQSHLVQLFFYIAATFLKVAKFTRNEVNPKFNYSKVEHKLNSLVHNLDMEEIAIIAHAFFRSGAPIQDRTLLTIVIQKTAENIDVIHSTSLIAMFKIIGYSINYDQCKLLCKLLECTIPQLPRLSMICVSHVVSAATYNRLFYPELLNAAAVRLYTEIFIARVKDITRLLVALSVFCYIPHEQPNILNAIIEELNESRRYSEINCFPGCLAKCLHSLSIFNLWPKNLIAKVLDPKTIKKMYRSDRNVVQEVFALDLDIEAEMPDYTGPRLNMDWRQNIAMRMTVPLPTFKDQPLKIFHYVILDVIRVCEKYLGSKKMFHVDHVLPQYCHPDIIVCLDAKKRPIPISSMLSQIPFGSVKRVPRIGADDTKWLALVVTPPNVFAGNTNRLLRDFHAKKRQLKHIGYDPVWITLRNWQRLENDKQKFEYLQYKVFR